MNVLNHDIQKILERLPHRYPFLMVDRVIQIDEITRSVCAIKNVTANESFFMGHFPDRPIMPGVLIVEALAQTAIFLTPDVERKGNSNKQYFLAGIRHARFKRPVIPGDQLILRVKLNSTKRNVFYFSGEATVENQLVADVEFVCAVKDAVV